MIDSKKILAELKHEVVRSGKTYAEIAKKLKISEATVKRIFNSGHCTLETLDALCKLLSFDFFDAAERARKREWQEPTFFTAEQEAVLDIDEATFCFFYTLLETRNVDYIKKNFTYSQAQIESSLDKFASVGLVKVNEDLRITLLVPHTIKWREDGLLQRRYSLGIHQEFFNNNFKSRDAFAAFISVPFSNEASEFLKVRTRELCGDMLSYMGSDTAMAKDRLWLSVAFRPWYYSLYRKYLR